MRFLRLSAILFTFAVSTFAQSAFNLLPVPRQQFLDNSGRPLAGGLLWSFTAGTSAPSPTFSDSSGAVANPNPVILDSGGRASVWLDSTKTYKLKLQTAAGVDVWTVDNVSSAGGSGGGSGSGTVTSVFGRVGAVLANTGDYTAAQVTNAATTNSSNAWIAGTQNFSGAAHTLPAKVGTLAARPSACTPGEIYFVTDAAAGSNLTGCTAANTWTTLGGGAGSFSGGLITSDLYSTNAASIGTTVSPFYNVVATNAVEGSIFRTVLGNTAAPTDYFDWSLSGTHVLNLRNSTNQAILTVNNTGTANDPNTFSFIGHLIPKNSGAVDLGARILNQPYYWRRLYLSDGMYLNGTQVLDSAGNLTVTSCNGCATSPGSGFVPLSGGTMTGAILPDTAGHFDFGSAILPLHEGWFQLLNTEGAIQSQATGSSIAFQTQNTKFQVDGNGNISGAGQVNLTSATSAYKMNGTTMVDYAGVIYAAAGIKQGATTVLDSGGNLTVTSCNGCATSPGSGFVPLAGGTMTGPIVPDTAGHFDFGSASKPLHEGWFQLLDVTGAIQSEATGASIAFQTSNSAFQVNGAGDISGLGSANMTGTTSAYKMGGITVIDAARNATVHDLSINGTFTCTGTGCPSGSGSFLSVAGGTMTGAILPSASGTIDFGSAGLVWHEGWFGLIDATGAIQSEAIGSNIAFQTHNNLFQVDGSGNISGWGSVNMTGPTSAYKMGGTTVIDASRNATVHNLTMDGAFSCTGTGCPSGSGGVTTLTAGPPLSLNGSSSQTTVSGAVTLTCPGCITSLPFSLMFTTGGQTITGIDTFSAGMYVQYPTNPLGMSSGGILYANTLRIQTPLRGSLEVVNNSGQFIGPGIDVGGNGISAGGYNVSGGFIGQTWDVVIPGGFTINGNPYTTLVFKGGVLASAQ